MTKIEDEALNNEGGDSIEDVESHQVDKEQIDINK